jgi:hypothetical protein
VHKAALFCAGWKDKEKMGAGGFLCVLRKPAFIRYEQTNTGHSKPKKERLFKGENPLGFFFSLGPG